MREDFLQYSSGTKGLRVHVYFIVRCTDNVYYSKYRLGTGQVLLGRRGGAFTNFTGIKMCMRHHTSTQPLNISTYILLHFCHIIPLFNDFMPIFQLPVK